MPKLSPGLFRATAEGAFQFLVDDYGFSLTSVEELPPWLVTILKYERGSIVVRVTDERMSGDVAVTIQRRNLGESYTVGEVARLAGATDVPYGTGLHASTDAEVVSGVPKVARILAQYGQRGLQGDESFFEALQRQQVLESEAYLKQRP